MAIRIISGPPRSGKSFYAVRHLYKSYFTPSGVRKKKYQDLVIVSNIENLTLEHIPLSRWLAHYDNKPELLFSRENQEKIAQKHKHVVYFIDEAQMLFPDDFERRVDRDKKVGQWLQYHGHLGQDIYLITQSHNLLPRTYVYLAEEITKALPRTLALFSSQRMHYKSIDPRGEPIPGTQFSLLKDQKIFDLYKSQDLSETQSVKNPLTRLVLAGVVVVLVGVTYGIYTFSSVFSSPPSPPSEISTHQPFRSAPPPPPADPLPSTSILYDFATRFYDQSPPLKQIADQTVVRHRVDHIRVHRNSGPDRIVVEYKNRIVDLDELPYPAHWVGGQLFLIIPHHHPLPTGPAANASTGRERESRPTFSENQTRGGSRFTSPWGQI